MKTKIQDKIYWYGFKRQLKELYYLLFAGEYISCTWDEFLSHFRGKKFKIEKKFNRKLKWEGDGYLLAVVSNHLIQKGFLNSGEDIPRALKNNFAGIPRSSLNKKNRNNSTVKNLQSKLDSLFPATSGYRCKERLYYKARNKEPQRDVLKNCGVI